MHPIIKPVTFIYTTSLIDTGATALTYLRALFALSQVVVAWQVAGEVVSLAQRGFEFQVVVEEAAYFRPRREYYSR